ncbi:imidazole glycerol phosphate synthase subunit HisH [Leptolyngbya sp. PCC 6406]|uniref:imidazole glycerol phosphate synthase subunit HisH n=1 Tax=Leptolyngbya sp. PCC 6406 TaxID=1173264 RepID=UPI0002AC970E|nr:imidazole glycerol phosphate synthase subunit HisH [Leptolyngbya sp. PCC 6406]
MITIIDSGIANIGSVVAAYRRLGVATTTTTQPKTVATAKALILPGVGAFADGMESLRQKDLVQPILDAAAAGVPILGICLGMQLLAEVSEEFGEHQGLGLIPGRVIPLQPAQVNEQVPNIGWCDVSLNPQSSLFQGMNTPQTFYFVHSYYLNCSDPRHAVATIPFGNVNVTAAVAHRNIFGVQFHPEKSQDTGLQLLNHFARNIAPPAGVPDTAVV